MFRGNIWHGCVRDLAMSENGGRDFPGVGRSGNDSTMVLDNIWLAEVMINGG